MKPVIGLNMWPASYTEAGGSLYYATSLINDFAKICPERFVLFYGSHNVHVLENLPGFKKFRKIKIRRADYILKHLGMFDVLFTPGTERPTNLPDRPSVIFIPDIQEHFYPHFFSPLELLLRQYFRFHAAKSSSLVITISEYSKNTLVGKLELNPSRVKVIYLGCSPVFFDHDRPGMKPSQLPEDFTDYLFFPANSWKHKNHEKLFDALALIKKNYGLVIPCVLTGHILKGQFNNFDIRSEIKKRGLEESVCHVGRVTLNELKYLYTNAMALIMPSLFEGFGIPLVEAMASNCPIIASCRTSIPEIAGDSALYFNPDDPEDIAVKILFFINDAIGIKKRIEIGNRLVERFSNIRQAQRHLELFDEAYEIEKLKRQQTNIPTEIRSQTGALPILGVIVSSSKLFPIYDQLVSLAEEFSRNIQIFWVTKNSGGSSIPAPPENFKIMYMNEDFHDIVSDIVVDCTAKFFYFSDGRSVPLPSFTRFLIKKSDEIDSNQEILQGESLFSRSSGTGSWMDLIPSGNDEDDRKQYCIKNQSLVIRREALQRCFEISSERFCSPSELLAYAWDHSTRKRVYNLVNRYRIGNKYFRLDESLPIFVQRIEKSFVDSTKAKWFLGMPIFRWALYASIYVYLILPGNWPAVIWKGYGLVSRRLSRPKKVGVKGRDFSQR